MFSPLKEKSRAAVGFADGIKDYISEKGMSVNAFCKHAGISVSGLLAVLSGKAEPSPATVMKCADAMNCSADYLLGLSDRREYIPARSPAEFKDRIFPLLKTRGITQYRLACDCGLQQSAISKWKHGKLPKAETLVLLADYLHCSADYLLGRSDLT